MSLCQKELAVLAKAVRRWICARTGGLHNAFNHTAMGNAIQGVSRSGRPCGQPHLYARGASAAQRLRSNALVLSEGSQLTGRHGRGGQCLRCSESSPPLCSRIPTTNGLAGRSRHLLPYLVALAPSGIVLESCSVEGLTRSVWLLAPSQRPKLRRPRRRLPGQIAASGLNRPGVANL